MDDRLPVLDTVDLAAYLDEVRAVNETLVGVNARPARTPAQVAKARRLLLSSASVYARASSTALAATEVEIPGPAGPLVLRVVRPETVRAVYLDLHGGGWIMGTAEMNDADNTELAVACDVAVVSPEYRLAPEHPYPAGPDDCEAAACWLVDNAAPMFGTPRLLIGGASAGAHLAALTLLRLRDRHGTAERFEAANLVFGVYDLSLTPSMRAAEDGLLLRTDQIRAVIDHFLPGRTGEELRDPAVSPLYADLRGLPPALFTVGALDGLLDDSLFMAARWNAAGNGATLAVYPESPHGFSSFSTGLAGVARLRIYAWLRQVLDAGDR